MKIAYIIIFSVLLSNIITYGQSSYLKVLEENISPQTNLEIDRIATSSNGGVSYTFDYPQGAFKLVQLSSSGDILYASTINTDASEGYWKPLSRLRRKNNWHLIVGNGHPFTTNQRNAVFIVNLETGIAWGKQISMQSVRNDGGVISNSGKVFCSNYLLPGGAFTSNKLGIANLELETGNQLWGYFYEKMGSSNTSYTFIDMKEISSTNLSVLTKVYSNGSPVSHALLKITFDGTVEDGIGIVNDSLDFFSKTTDTQSNIYLAGRNRDGPELDGTLFSDGFIVKLDADYNVIWTKKLVAEQFPCHDLEIETLPDGNLIFSYLSKGHLPIITGEISTEGDLIWYKGYAIAAPKMAIGTDGSIYFSSGIKYYEDGSTEPAQVVAKTTPDGKIEGCHQFDACLELEDMELIFEPWEWERSDAPFLPAIDVNIEPAEFSIYDHCGTPVPPQADFYIPDTVCQFTCLSPSNLKSSLANHIEWTIVGANIDTTIVDTSFYWCFDSVGTYTIEQEIWVLGCSEFFTKTLEVILDNLEISLGEDRFLCETSYLLSSQGNRPLQTFYWNDGSENSTLLITQSGTYSLNATDGYCADIDTITLTSIEDWLNEEPLILPPDITICPDLLPFVLKPESVYNSTFFLDQEPKSNSTFILTKEGKYTVSIEIEDCIFSENFELKLEDCKVPIYLANAFSPNNDGINDIIFPQGHDFEGVSLQIYNRWGDMLFQTEGAPFSWDGKFHGKILNPGIYILVFTYFNQRNLREEVISKDVLLTR